MSPDPLTVTPKATVGDARDLLIDHGFRHLPIVAEDDGRLLGILSDRDVAINPRALRAAVRDHSVADLLDDDRPVEAVMTRDPHVITVDADLGDAARILVSRQINALPVIDDAGRLVGILSSVDCLLGALQAAGRPTDDAVRSGS